MGNNTIIQLPLHVRARYLVEFVAKVVGEEFIKQTDAEHVSSVRNGKIQSEAVPRPYDPSLPASKANPWRLKFARLNKGLCIDVSNSKSVENGSLEFMDVAGNTHSWFFHAEDEFEVNKTLRPGSHGFAVAVGRRAVKFFGGQLIESDFNDKVSLKVSNARATFPQKLATQSSDDRWYQFYNALDAEPLLTARELKVAIEQHGANEEHVELLGYLQKLENREHLEEVLPQASAGLRKPRM